MNPSFIAEEEGENMAYDVLVVGGGIAGLTAALYTCRAGKTVLVLEKENPGGRSG